MLHQLSASLQCANCILHQHTDNHQNVIFAIKKTPKTKTLLNTHF